jgi:hypothetical protein
VPGSYLHSGYLDAVFGYAFLVVVIALCVVVAIRLNKSWRDRNPK